MGTDLVPGADDIQKSGTEDSTALALRGVNATNVGVVMSGPERFDLSGYFTSIIQDEGLDPHDPNTVSLYKRLAEMDRLLGSSADFPHSTVQEVFNNLPDEGARIKHMEGLVLRLSLAIQSLNDSLVNFVRGAGFGEKREILVGKPSETGYKDRLDTRDLSRMLGLVIAQEQEGCSTIEPYLPIIPLNYIDHPRINKDSRLVGSIGNDGTFNGALKWKYDYTRWIERRYLRLGYGNYSSHPNKTFWKKVVAEGEEIIGDINNGVVTVHIYNSILEKIRALLLQLGDIGVLFNNASENDSKKRAGTPPIITF